MTGRFPAAQVLATARTFARERGLLAEDCEDFAVEFAAWLCTHAEAVGRAHAPAMSCWVRRCASNAASNYARGIRRREHHIRCLSARAADAGRAGGPDPDPVAATLRGEAMRAIRNALDQLPPAQRRLFVRHHLDGISAADIARSTGRTPGAVRQELLTIRRRLAALLANTDWTEEDLRACAAPSQRGG